MLGKRFERLYKFLVDSYSDMSLKHRLLVGFGGLMVLGVLIVGAFSYSITQNYVYEQASESFYQTLVQFKTNIESRLRIYDEMTYQAALDKGLAYALSNRYESDAEYTYEYHNTIRRVLEIRQKDNNIMDAFFLKNNDTLPEVSGDLVPIEYSQHTWWFKKYFEPMSEFSRINDFINMSKVKIWSVTREDIKPSYNTSRAKDNNLKIGIYKPVIQNFERLIGIIVVYVKYESIFDELNLNDINDHIFIADQNGEIIFDSRSRAVEGNGLGREYLSNIKGRTHGSFRLKEGKTKSIIMFNQAEESGWTYFRRIPIQTLMASAGAIRRFTALIALFSIIVCFIIAVKIAGVISGRLAVLSHRMEGVDDLDLNIYVDIHGNDEIGKLAGNYNKMVFRIRELISQLKHNQQILRESELKALQAQINPHFLYNTLATINWMAMDGNTDKIITMVDNLSIFYRLSLNKGRQWLKVKQEIEHINAYIDIQRVRLDERISVFFDIDHDIEECYILKLLLQPFIENSIMHGAGSKKEKLNIIIRRYLKDEVIFLEIIDDGVGMRNIPSADDYPETGGYGIRNVNDKIKLQHGNEYGVRLFSRPGVGTVAVIMVPAIRSDSLPEL